MLFISENILLFISGFGILQAFLSAGLLYFHPRSDRSVSSFLALYIALLSAPMLIPFSDRTYVVPVCPEKGKRCHENKTLPGKKSLQQHLEHPDADGYNSERIMQYFFGHMPRRGIPAADSNTEPPHNKKIDSE